MIALPAAPAEEAAELQLVLPQRLPTADQGLPVAAIDGHQELEVVAEGVVVAHRGAPPARETAACTGWVRQLVIEASFEVTAAR